MAQNPTETSAQNPQNVSRRTSPAHFNTKVRWGSYLLLGTAFLFLVQGVGMIYRALIENRYELGVPHLGGKTAKDVAAMNPAIQSYIDHLAVNVGGLMIALGIAMGILVWYGVRSGQLWALYLSVSIPSIYALIGLPLHQTVHFHFDQFVHLGPAGVGIPLLFLGFGLSYLGIRAENHESQSIIG